MTGSSDNALQPLQAEVERSLGRCLLQLQQYERLVKAIVAHSELSGTADSLRAAQLTRIAETARQTLGTVVGSLFETCVFTHEAAASRLGTMELPDDALSFGFQMYVSLSEANLAQTVDELKEFVRLRNELVHHFLDLHDLWSLDGCRDALAALAAAGNRIDREFGRLRDWAERMAEIRRQAAEFLGSDTFRDLFVDGIAPDGTIDWPAAGIVRALREAAGELAVDGWASIAEAASWIVDRFPLQTPARYGCSSWRHAVHRSQAFEIRYFEIEGQRSARYRERVRPAQPH